MLHIFNNDNNLDNKNEKNNYNIIINKRIYTKMIKNLLIKYSMNMKIFNLQYLPLTYYYNRCSCK